MESIELNPEASEGGLQDSIIEYWGIGDVPDGDLEINEANAPISGSAITTSVPPVPVSIPPSTVEDVPLHFASTNEFGPYTISKSRMFYLANRIGFRVILEAIQVSMSHVIDRCEP